MGWFDFLTKTKAMMKALFAAKPKQKPQAHRRADVVREHAKRPPATAPRAVPRGGIHEQRQRDIIHESLSIAATTKRRDTAESRLRVVEELLDELAAQGLETMEDVVNRQTLRTLRDGLDRRFMGRPKK